MTIRNDVDHESAWYRYWQPGRSHSGGGCLPARWAPIDAVQRAAWAGFAEDLPREASVLDLATGDGRVLAMLKDARSDIEATGVDFAPQLPPPPPGTTSRGGIRMEELPFEENSFDAVTSQFGFEYGDVETIANETARVLRPGGAAGLIVHRGDGPILAHNAARAEQIDFVLSGELPSREHLGPDHLADTMSAAGRRVREAVDAYGKEGVAWEIAEALRRSVLLVQRAGADEAWLAIGTILDEARGERDRIASLSAACGVADDRDRLDAAFGSAGLQVVSRTSLEADGDAFADMIRLRA